MQHIKYLGATGSGRVGPTLDQFEHIKEAAIDNGQHRPIAAGAELLLT